MKIEDQVPTLEQCRKLKELGVELDTIWYWVEDCELIDEINCVGNGKFGLAIRDSVINTITPSSISAPTVAELGVLLPFYYPFIWHSFCDNAGGYLNLKETKKGKEKYFEEKTEAQARWAGLIWLITEGYLKAEDLIL